MPFTHNSKLLIMICFAFSIIFCSCQTYTYRYKAPTVNTALFTEKGDFQVGITGAPETGGFNAAYAFTKNFGVAVGASFSNESDSVMVQNNFGASMGRLLESDNQSDYEIAAMYFNTIANTKLRYEVQLGYAYNERIQKIETNIDLTNTVYENYVNKKFPAYSRFFIQPAIGKNGKYFDWSAGIRIQSVNYKDLAQTYPSAGIANYSDLVFEPVATVRGGYRFIKAMVQMGFRIAPSNGPYDYIGLHMGFGLVAPFNAFTKKRKETD